MCGRITLTSAPHLLAEKFFLDMVPDLMPRFNIAPSQDIPAVIPNPNAEGRLVRMFRWGLVPPWSKGPDVGAKLINARSETVLEKPSFREAFARRRCLVPVDGFYEWQKRDDGRQPFYFSSRRRTPLALAGLWERWEYPGGRRLDSCTILTTAANSTMRPIHHRMPVIVPEADWRIWLELPPEKAETLVDLLKPAAADALLAWPVNRHVNRPDFDEPQCVEPVWDDPGGQLNLFG